MWFVFALATTLIWGTAELFYKKGVRPDEQLPLKNRHLRWCGHGTPCHIYTLTQDISFNPINILRYLPVFLLYIGSMVFSYFWMRFIEESISDPIENTSGAICSLYAWFS